MGRPRPDTPATLETERRNDDVRNLRVIARNRRRAVAGAYFLYFWGVDGATPGKRMLALRVTRSGTIAAGTRIGVGRALLRLIGMTAGGLFFVDLLVAFLHRDHRALHDLMADSIVVSVR